MFYFILDCELNFNVWLDLRSCLCGTYPGFSEQERDSWGIAVGQERAQECYQLLHGNSTMLCVFVCVEGREDGYRGGSR